MKPWQNNNKEKKGAAIMASPQGGSQKGELMQLEATFRATRYQSASEVWQNARERPWSAEAGGEWRLPCEACPVKQVIIAEELLPGLLRR